jgi:hypothetical protein
MANTFGVVRVGGGVSGGSAVTDSFSHEGAQRLACRVADYWHRRGRVVQTWPERVVVSGLCAVWVVRSDLVNGFPRA